MTRLEGRQRGKFNRYDAQKWQAMWRVAESSGGGTRATSREEKSRRLSSPPRLFPMGNAMAGDDEKIR